MAHSIHTKLARNRAKLLDVVATLSEAQLDLRGAEGWSIREMLIHILNAEEDNIRVAAAIAGGRADLIPEAFDLDAHNQRRVAERGTLSRADLLAALAVQRTRTEALLARLSADQLARVGWHPLAGEATVSDVLRFIVLHDPLHLRDIKAILDESG